MVDCFHDERKNPLKGLVSMELAVVEDETMNSSSNVDGGIGPETGKGWKERRSYFVRKEKTIQREEGRKDSGSPVLYLCRLFIEARAK